jgi:anti-sigma regulatory factor (Ser/Thr protein kinase)
VISKATAAQVDRLPTGIPGLDSVAEGGLPLGDDHLVGLSARALGRGEWTPTVLRSVAFEVPGGTTAPSMARHRVLEKLGEVLSAEERSDLALVISELVTNSVRHAGMVGQSHVIKVRAAVAPNRTRIEVCDSGPGFEPGKPKMRSFEGGRGGGLGLVLLDRLSAAWGVAAEEDVCVWAEFERTQEQPS